MIDLMDHLRIGDIDGFVATVTHYLPVEAQQGDDAVYLSARAAQKEFRADAVNR